MSEQNRERDKFIIEQSKKDGISGVDEVYVNTRCREAWDASRDALQVLHEKWCPHFHVEYMKVKEELAALLESAGEFDEKAAIDRACEGIYWDNEDTRLRDSDSRLSQDRITFVKGARWQHEQAKAREAALVAEIEEVRQAGVTCMNAALDAGEQVILRKQELQKELAVLQLSHHAWKLMSERYAEENKELREENEKLKASYIKGHAKGLELGRSNCVDAQAKLTEQSELLREVAGELKAIAESVYTYTMGKAEVKPLLRVQLELLADKLTAHLEKSK